MRIKFAAAIALCSIAGCSPTNDLPLGSISAAAFHRELNAGQFDAVYAATTPAFKISTPATSLLPILSAVHRKLGLFKSGKVVGWNDGVTMQGHLLNLNMSSSYEKGAATETFTFTIDGGKALIRAYNINSPVLITS